MPKKIHPADQADLDAIAQAVGFCVHMRRGPADVFKQEAPTLTKAVAIANQVRAENKGRDCLVYAITAEGNSIPVPKSMQRPAGKYDGRAAVEALARANADIYGLDPATGKPRAKPVTNAGRKAKRPTAPASGRPMGRRAEIADNATKGILPPAPDFSAETHKRFRGMLAEIVALVEAGDVAALKAFPINPYSSSPKALDKYRNLAVIALEARQKETA